MPITTLGIGAAVTPTVVKTTFSHYTNRKPRAQKPTAHISYDQGLHLVRSFLLYASHHTVDEVQAFTGQWVPHPTWTRTENVPIPEENIKKAAELITAELGDEGIKAVGGRTWWQWRKKGAALKAEWIEMRSDYNERQRGKKKCRRIMLYVHGGAYFFGSVDEHRYQLQRHARKLQARVFAPRYRLAPQFPFPCGMLDCLAAYIYLLTIHEPTEIIFAGDSAGGGMILSMLCLLRDQQMPLPAGAILISPWVDLTHSFPSLSREDGLDYIPPHGFMQKPSRSWPPPNEDEIYEIVRAATEHGPRKSTDQRKISGDDWKLSFPEAGKIAERLQPPLCLRLDGKEVLVKDQVQLYTTNQLITHPLVSPALQPSLGGLPPLLIMVGDGELLRDEQIYVAHKAADPQKYRLNDIYRKRYDPDDAILDKYPPTPVQLQVWEDLCHVTPTLSFTRPAKFMYRSIAQFGAWALSRAQKRGIEIIDDDDDDSSSTSSEDPSSNPRDLTNGKPTPNGLHAQVGRAGDKIPPFRSHMIREQVDRHGDIYPLPRATELPALQMPADLVGVVKEGPIRRWLTAKQEWDDRYRIQRRRIQKKRIAAYKAGNRLVYGDNEIPPPSALAGRLHGSEATKADRLKKSWGLGLWSSWGWKRDERIVHKDAEYVKEESKRERSRSNAEPTRGRDNSPGLTSPPSNANDSENRSSSAAAVRRKTVTVLDMGQLEDQDDQMSLAQEKDMTSQHSNPALAIDPPTPTAVATDEEQNSSPIFLPKWKQAPHLKNESRDISDSGSTYSRMTMQDDMSTRAVFSGPGVQRQSSNLLEHSTSNTDPAGDPPLSNFRPSTPGPRDNLGGYDTPVSKRSVERLQSNQMDVNDDRSGHSSLPMDAADPNPRMDPIRSPSSVAIVHAEGVISPSPEETQEETQPKSEPKTSSVQQHKSENSPDAQPVHVTVVKPTDDQKRPDQIDGAAEPSDEPTQRPPLYDRDDSNFVTAMEKL